MRMRLALVGLCLLALGGCGVQPQLLAMRKITSPEGWPGTAFYSNGALESEELDTTGKTGIPDLWRFYDNGVLIKQEQDRNRDGQIDEIKIYDDATLIIIRQDTNYDGQFDYYKDLRIKEKPVVPTSCPASGANTPPAASRATGSSGSSAAATSGSLTADDIFGNSAGSNTAVGGNRTPTTPVVIEQPSEVAPSAVDRIQPTTSSEPGSVVRPITPPANLTPAPGTHSGSIVPGPTFAHPSAGLEE